MGWHLHIFSQYQNSTHSSIIRRVVRVTRSQYHTRHLNRVSCLSCFGFEPGAQCQNLVLFLSVSLSVSLVLPEMMCVFFLNTTGPDVNAVQLRAEAGR